MDGGFWPGAFLDIALVVLALAILWGSIILHLAEQRRETVARASRTSANLADAAAAEIGRTIASIDQAMLLLRAAYVRAPDRFDIELWARQVAAADPPVLSYSIANATGRLVGSSLGVPVPPVDLAKLKVVRQQLGTHEDRLLISAPVEDELVHRRCVEFTRPIIATDGNFTGVLVLAADPARLAALFYQLNLGGGSLGLVGLDGIVRAREPDEAEAIGRDVSGSRLFADVLHHESGAIESRSAIDGVDRINGYHRLAGYPLFVVVGFDTRGVLAPWDRYRRQYLTGGTVLSVLVLAIGAMLLRGRVRLLRSRRDLSAAIDNIGQGLVMVGSQGRVLVANHRAAEMLGGLPPYFPVPLASGEHEEQRPDGRILEMRTQELPDGGAVRTYSDITERRATDQRILYLARHDVLTGLANRVMLGETLEAMIGEGGGTGFALLLLDLDRFRIVNASFGHAVGDAVLVEAAKRLRTVVGDGDVVARTGGDEFVLVLREDAGPGAAGQAAERALAALAEPVQAGFQRVFVSASVGVALFPAHGASAAELLHRAQAALDRTKALRRGSWLVFEAEMDIAVKRRRLVERELRAAIDTSAITLNYQPRVRLADGTVTCFEALLRWTHPEHGDIEPGTFIKIAEESGLIYRLGEWVLRSACLEANSWPEAVRVAVNVSISQVRSGQLPDLVARVLADTGLPTGRLELEVTESLLMEDADRTRSSLEALRAMGVRLALDDFGTGYSSPGYLLAFPFDEIKIDQSFVARLADDPGAFAIVQAIIGMASGLHLDVTAEGVETEAQLRVLRTLGCGAVQGFLLGRPLPANGVAGVLARLRETTF